MIVNALILEITAPRLEAKKLRNLCYGTPFHVPPNVQRWNRSNNAEFRCFRRLVPCTSTTLRSESCCVSRPSAH